MKIAIIGRTEILYDAVLLLKSNGYEIPLIITSKETNEYTKTAKDFELLANEVGAKYLCTSKIGSRESLNVIRNCEPIDIAISLNYSSIISQEVIDLFPLGILNAHGGDLPKYRGNACQAWAILNGEKKIGLCIHSMIGGEVDSGSIIAREYFDIDINTKVTQCWEWMAKKIPNLFMASIRELQDNSKYVLEIQSKDPKDALRCYPRVFEDGKINWENSNLDILRLVNASNKPFSGAYCNYNNKKIIIWDAFLYEDDENYLSEVGQVTNINNGGSVVVVCGKGRLQINLIEYDGFCGAPANVVKTIRKRFV